jgi:anti-sigma B factor antagonist
MQAGLEVDESHAPVVVIRLSGEVDVFSAPRLREKIIELVNQGCRLIVADLDAVDFLDSTGLGVLVGGLKRLRSHDGEMSVVCNEPRLLRVFALTRLDGVFAIRSTVSEAVTSLAGGG